MSLSLNMMTHRRLSWQKTLKITMIIMLGGAWSKQMSKFVNNITQICNKTI